MEEVNTVRRFVIILTLCVGCILAADAQSSFTQRLQKSNSGEGKVTVTQDKAIDDLVNGPAEQKAAPQKQPEKKVWRVTCLRLESPDGGFIEINSNNLLAVTSLLRNLSMPC